MPMYLYLGDITRMETDAIVNAAGTDLRRCPGICDAIFAAADTEKLELSLIHICHGHQGQHVPAALIVVGAAVLVVEVGQAEAVAVLAPQGRQTDAGDGTQEHGQGSI